MTTSFPTALDVIPDPGANTGTADAGFYHDVIHSAENDAIMALEAKVGINASPTSSTLDYMMHNHQHLGTDGSSKLTAFSVTPASDGPVFTATTAAGTTIFTINSTSAGPTATLVPPTATTPAFVIHPINSSQTADLTTWKNSAGSSLAGVTGTGTLYSGFGLLLTNGAGGTALFNANNAGNELQFLNGVALRGFSGAYTGEGGAGEQFHLDSAGGFLKLGGTSGQPEIQLNPWQVNRTAQIQSTGKDNADAGVTVFNTITDADGQVLTARSYLIQGNLGNTSTGTLVGSDNFFALSYPTFNGSNTYTKAAGISVIPNTNPTLTAGAVTINGNETVTGNVSVGGSLAVTGAASFSTAPSVPGLTVTGNETISGALSVTGATTLSSVSATTLTVTGTSSLNSTDDVNRHNVSAKYYRNAAWTTSTSASVMLFDTKEWDPHDFGVGTSAAYNTSTGVFTCPVAGRYQVHAGTAFTSSAVNEYGVVFIYQNGSQRRLNVGITPGSGDLTVSSVSATLNCAVGDTISIYHFYSNSGATGATGEIQTFLEINYLTH